MSGENETAPTAAEAHASDDVPVETSDAAPLAVAAEPAAAEAAPVSADAPAAEAQPQTDPATGKPPKLPEWAQKQLNNLAAEKRIAEREVKRLADELAASKAPKADPAPLPNAADAAAVRAATPSLSPAEFNAAVEAEAARREANARAAKARQEFDANSNKAFDAGKTAFGDEFGNAVQNLHQVGLLPYQDATGNVHNNEILEMVLNTDDPAKVLYELGSDPDRAAQIVAMSPAARAMEIAKLAVGAPARATPTPLSKAPRPIPSVDGSARVSASPSDSDSDEVFFAKRETELRAAGKW